MLLLFILLLSNSRHKHVFLGQDLRAHEMAQWVKAFVTKVYSLS